MRHQTISFIKSGIRIVGYLGLLCAGQLYGILPLSCAAATLIISEIIGIVEEFGHE